MAESESKPVECGICRYYFHDPGNDTLPEHEGVCCYEAGGFRPDWFVFSHRPGCRHHSESEQAYRTRFSAGLQAMRDTKEG